MGTFDSLIARSVPLIPRSIVRRVSEPYIAGESTDEATSVVSSLMRANKRSTVDVLGEDTLRPETAAEVAADYIHLLNEIDRLSLDASISVKLSAFGLKFDRALCEATLKTVVDEASRLGNFVRIDMEDSSCTQDTLDIFDRARTWCPEHAPGYSNVGIVLQACLRRTLADARRLASEGADVRICKGIYIEPKQIAWRERDSIRRNFSRTVEVLLAGTGFVGIATHDELLVWEALDLIERMGIPRDRYEFQMLLGVDRALEEALVDSGHPLRIYVPYGARWYEYSVRRLRENPAIAGYVLSGLFRRVKGGDTGHRRFTG